MPEHLNFSRLQFNPQESGESSGQEEDDEDDPIIGGRIEGKDFSRGPMTAGAMMERSRVNWEKKMQKNADRATSAAAAVKKKQSQTLADVKSSTDACRIIRKEIVENYKDREIEDGSAFLVKSLTKDHLVGLCSVAIGSFGGDLKRSTNKAELAQGVLDECMGLVPAGGSGASASTSTKAALATLTNHLMRFDDVSPAVESTPTPLHPTTLTEPNPTPE
jgi:hypothetical protein